MKSPSSTYTTKEQASKRKPVEIYHFWRDGGDDVYYTSGDVSFSYGGNTYVPVTIKREKTQYDSSLGVSKLTITLEIDETPIPDYLTHNPVEIIWVEVIKLFRDQSPAEGGSIFLGQIRSVTIKGVLATIYCVGFEYFLKQPIPKYLYSPTCNWSVFDSKCSLSNSSYTVSATLTAVSSNGLELTATEFGEKADGYFLNGDIVFNEYRRMIVNQSGSKITIRYAIPNLAVDDVVTAYAGCDGDIQTCKDKFNNVVNFGGQPYIPLDNPSTWD